MKRIRLLAAAAILGLVGFTAAAVPASAAVRSSVAAGRVTAGISAHTPRGRVTSEVPALFASNNAFAPRGMPTARSQSRAASAQSGASYVLCSADNGYCLAAGIHNDVYAITDFTYTAISFINEYTTPNGNRWYEIQTSDGGCLNWDPSNHYVYDDACHSGDPNELWYNHVAGQLINLGGNEDTGHDTYLSHGTCSDGACPLGASNTSFSGWQE
jgi:hypothetical protein